MSYFTELDRGTVKLGVAGKIMTPQQAADTLAAGADYVLLGRAAILHHDFPERARREQGFEPIALPVTREHLATEGLGPAFVTYMSTWPGFVEAA
jgi:2,4-dienoyl-CoA reductase-like NADH-dependent reductase (Old Yellow Enzyme family)